MPTYDSGAALATDLIYANAGCIGGPAFAQTSSVCSTNNGSEQRNSTSRHARRAFSINTGTIDETNRALAYAHYTARRGQSDSFRFKDPFDYEASGEPIVSGQLVKRYTVGAISYDRPITKPISGTVTFGGGGTLDYETGIISGGAGGTWSGEFEIQARYASDTYSERNFFSSWHEVDLEIIEAFDSNIPATTAGTLASTITYAFALPLEIGRRKGQQFSTDISRTDTYAEERTPLYSAQKLIFGGTCMLENKADLETLISLFLCVRGPRTAFQYESLNVRFRNDALRIRTVGTNAYECEVEFVEI